MTLITDTMIFPSHFGIYWERSNWEEAFCVLGLKRCQALLRVAGIPEVMTSSPEGLVRASYYFWQRIWDNDPIDVGPDWTKETFTEELYAQYLESYEKSLLALVKETFSMLATQYGKAATNDLYYWTLRHFIDPTQVRRWNVWRRLFLGLVRETWFYYPLASPALAAGVLKRVKDIARVCEHLLCLDEDDDEPEARLLIEARNIPLSPIENRMVALTPVHPGDPTQIDVLLKLRFVLNQEAAYWLWRELDAWLEESDRQALLAWGREQAPIMGESAESVSLPERVLPG